MPRAFPFFSRSDVAALGGSSPVSLHSADFSVPGLFLVFRHYSPWFLGSYGAEPLLFDQGPQRGVRSV